MHFVDEGVADEARQKRVINAPGLKVLDGVEDIELPRIGAEIGIRDRVAVIQGVLFEEDVGLGAIVERRQCLNQFLQNIGAA